VEKSVTNTTEKYKQKNFALEFLQGQMENPGSKPIEDMEAAGQRELVNSNVLPVVILHSSKEDFLALGFTFGELVEGDELFCYATLPEGWSRQGTSHNMWSIIVDETGKERVAIFYKAAFYDRRAHMELTRERGDAHTE
jgi:hypothetical protein